MVVQAFQLFENRRPEVDGLGVVLGAVVTKDGRCIIHSETKRKESSLWQLIRLLQEINAIPGDFHFSSLQILKNANVKRHRDANEGVSLLVSFGQFEGGLLVYGDAKIDTFQKPCIIDGQIDHHVEPFVGNRYSIALYAHPRACELSNGDLAFLAKVGFKVAPAALAEKSKPTEETSPKLASECGRLHLLEIGVALNAAAGILAEKEKLGLHLVVDEGADVHEACQKRCPEAVVSDFTNTWDQKLIQGFFEKSFGAFAVVVASLNGGDKDVDAIALLEQAVQSMGAVHTKFIVIAAEGSKEHFPYISELLAAMPFTTKLAFYAPLKGRAFFWLTGDIDWPKGAKDLGYKMDCLDIRPPPAKFKEKFPADLQEFILTGWKCKNTDQLGSNVLYEGVFTAEGKTDRHLYAGEYERLLGMDVNASNGITRHPGESLSERETRRKALLASCWPRKTWSFLCHAAVINLRGASLGVTPP